MEILSVFVFVIVAGTRQLESPIVMIPKLLIGTGATVIVQTGPGEARLHLAQETRPQNLSALAEEELAQWVYSRKPSTQETPTLHDISSCAAPSKRESVASDKKGTVTLSRVLTRLSNRSPAYLRTICRKLR